MEDKDKLQVEETAVAENIDQVATVDVVEEVTAEVVAVEPYKVIETEEEFNKLLQSASSKAKGEILKELGIDTVNAFKEQFDKVTQFEAVESELIGKKAEIEQLRELNNSLEKALLTSKYALTDEVADIFVATVHAKKGDRDLIEVADEVYNTLLNGFKTVPTKVVFGSEKTTTENKDERLDAFTRGLGL